MWLGYYIPVYEVAENQQEKGTELLMELVAELRDRQRNSYAQVTFSEPVDTWCRLVRTWYSAMDETGIAVE